APYWYITAIDEPAADFYRYSRAVFSDCFDLVSRRCVIAEFLFEAVADQLNVFRGSHIKHTELQYFVSAVAAEFYGRRVDESIAAGQIGNVNRGLSIFECLSIAPFALLQAPLRLRKRAFEKLFRAALNHDGQLYNLNLPTI